MFAEEVEAIDIPVTISLQVDMSRIQFKNEAVSGSSTKPFVGMSVEFTPYFEFGYAETGLFTLDPSIESDSDQVIINGDDSIET